MSMNWRSRLTVSVEDPGSETPIHVTPIDALQPSFSFQAEPVHSIEDTHLGVIYSPDQINFSMTVKAIGGTGAPAAKLTQLAIQGKPFNIVLETKEGEEDDWAFESIVLSDCIITNATPTNAAISGAPTATFSGFALAASTLADGSDGTMGAMGSADTKAGIPAEEGG